EAPGGRRSRRSTRPTRSFTCCPAPRDERGARTAGGLIAAVQTLL
ncbi:MAG: hypothetical protein AVDCRST_MAG66-2812, partial [uncultured Pseudonocardia sp.]